MAKLTLEEIKQRVAEDWGKFLDSYAIGEERAKRCAPQDLLDRRWLIAEVERLDGRVKEADAA